MKRRGESAAGGQRDSGKEADLGWRIARPIEPGRNAGKGIRQAALSFHHLSFQTLTAFAKLVILSLVLLPLTPWFRLAVLFGRRVGLILSPVRALDPGH